MRIRKGSLGSITGRSLLRSSSAWSFALLLEWLASWVKIAFNQSSLVCFSDVTMFCFPPAIDYARPSNGGLPSDSKSHNMFRLSPTGILPSGSQVLLDSTGFNTISKVDDTQ